MILVVYGDDGLRVKERVEALRGHFVQKYDAAGMNVDDVVWKAEADTALVRELSKAAPFLAEKRMVIVRGVMEGMTKGALSQWVEIVDGLPASTVFLFADVLTGADDNVLMKELKSKVDVHFYPLESLKGAAFGSWLSDRAKQLGMRFTPQAWQLFVARVQDEPPRALLELQKLSAYAKGEEIGPALVERLVAGVPEEDIFGFLDSLERGGAVALRRLRQERTAGASAFPLFGMLSRQNRLLLLASAETGQSEASVAKALGVPGFAARKLLGTVRRFSFARLRAGHRRLTFLDQQMKSGLDPEIAVDRAIADLLPPQSSSR